MKLPFDLNALWARGLAWYQGYSERDRRIILGVLVATVASIVYLGIVTPVLEYRRGISQRIADGQEELERAHRFLAAKDTLRAEREDLRKRLTQAKSRLLPGGTGTLGAAALQERANAIASERGITVQSTQVMKDEAMDPFRKVAVRLTLSGELKPLAELISGLEYDRQLTIPFIEVSRRGAVAGGKGPRNLSVTVEVTGFVQGGAKGGDAGKPEGEGDAHSASAEASADTPADAPSEEVAAAAATVAIGTTSSTTTSPTTTSVAAAAAPPAGVVTTTLPAGAVPGSAAALRRRATAPGAPGVPRLVTTTLPGAVAGAPTTTLAVVAPPLGIPITLPTLVVPTPTVPGVAPLPEPADAEVQDTGEPPPPPESMHPAEPPVEEAHPPVLDEEHVEDEEAAE